MKKDRKNNVHSLSEPSSKKKVKIFSEKEGDENTNQENLQNMMFCYMEALEWILRYYFHGCVSWEYFYPYHYAPFASDLIEASLLLRSKEIHFEMGVPLKPFEQLLCVLPPNHDNLLPVCYRKLMTAENSPIQHFYPKQVEVDKEVNKRPWEHVTLLPFIDIDLLLKSVGQWVDLSLLSEDENKRNRFGATYSYSFDKEKKRRTCEIHFARFCQ